MLRALHLFVQFCDTPQLVCLMFAVLFYVLDILWYISLGILLAGLALVGISLATYILSFIRVLGKTKARP